MAKKLRDDQVGDLVFMMQNPKGMLLHDPGTGKTPPVCVNQFRRVQDGLGRTVWTQPKHLLKKNMKELLEWTPFTARDVAIVDGTKAQIDRAMNSGAQVLLMGPDRFKRIWKDLPADVRNHDVDEMHMCFGGAGARFDMRQGWIPSDRVSALYASNDNFDGATYMTGSLVNGRLDTAFPAIHTIEPRYYPFGYDEFLGQHAYTDETGKPYAWHSHERLGQILGRHGVRRTFEQVYGKQAIIFDSEWLSMNEKQKAAYAEFEAQAVLELENFLIEGINPGVATIRARQIMEHPNCFKDLRDPDGKLGLPSVDICPGERPAKLEALEVHFDHHSRRGTPVIVFASLVPQLIEIAELAARMGRRVGLLYGDIPSRKRNWIDEAFQRGELDTIVASPPVAAVGYNWQFCGEVEVDHVIFSSLTYMHTDFFQGWRRAVRGPRTKPLRVTAQGYLESAVELKVRQINITKSEDAHKVDPTQDVITFNSHEEMAA